MFGYDWPRLHAALNDLPAALLAAAVFFDVVAVGARRPAFRQVGFWTLIVGVLGAAAAVVSGLQAEDHIAHGEAVHRVMESHETFAWATLAVFAALAVWRVAREGRMGGAERGASLALGVLGVGILFTTGMYGGKLVFEHAAGIPTAVLQDEMHERSEGHHHGAAEAGHAHEAPASAPNAAASATRDSAMPAAGDSAAPAAPGHTHSHPPGTPPHRD